MRTGLLLPFVLLLGLAARPGPARELELVYLANEGFLVSAGETRFLIDVFVTEPYSMYAAVPAELFEDLLAGRPPFEGLDLALTSHVHRDHFQEEPALRFLRAHPQVPFVSAPEVLDALRAELGTKAAQLRPLLPEPGETTAAQEGGIALELLRLPHSGDTLGTVQNLGHLVQLGGVRILHVGDAEVSSEALAGYGLAQRSIDLALVPYWWLGNEKAVARVRALLGPARLVAMHVPPGEIADVRKGLTAIDREILLFEEAGEAQRLEFAE